MYKEEFNQKTKIIRETFRDTRKIRCITPDDVRKLNGDVYQGGDVFTTEDGEFIDFETQYKDFDEVELAKYIGFAENLYEKHKKPVSVYIMCPSSIKICVREHRIYSDCEFTIKLACSQEDPCQFILKAIKNKIKNHQILDSDDLSVVEKLPVMCRREDRYYFRVESLKIINRIHY